MAGNIINVFSLIFLCLCIVIRRFEASDATANTSCIQSELEALKKFKIRLKDPSNFLSSWIGEDCCTWKGISCSSETGHVIKIDLHNQDCFKQAESNQNSSCLGGEISSSLLDLKYLTYLDLSLNDFGIQIPPFLGSLGLLSYLNLSSSAFTGMVPSHLGNLSNLCYLDLQSSYLHSYVPNLWVSDMFWVSSLTSLEYLDMDYVNLSLANPHWLQAINLLPSLLELHLTACQLQSLPESLPIVNFTSLSTIELGNNGFTSSIPQWISNLSVVVTLDLSSNGIKGDIIDLVGGLSKCCNNSLEQLILSDNKISGKLPPDSLAQLKKLRTLDLYINSISDSLPISIGSLTNLEKLDLSYNQLNGSIPESIKELTKLDTLNILQNNWQGVLSQNQLQGLKKLTSFSASSSSEKFFLNVSHDWVPPFSLTYIEIRHCIFLGSKFPVWLKAQNQLFTIILSDVGISDVIPDWLWTLCLRASWCDFSYNQIRGTLPQSFEFHLDSPKRSSLNKSKGLIPFRQNIKYLNLASNFISGEISSNIGQILTSLIFLNLSGNIMNGPIPSSVDEMRNLSQLDLSNNKLSGKMQDHWKHLVELTVLDLSMNNLSGTIPGSIFSLPKLLTLKLSDNNLSGDLSFSPIKDTSLLSFLDLGGNKFSGKIPTWFGESLIILSELRLRNNMFSGRIPKQLCNLVCLHILDMAFNNLSGSIPECLGNLSGFYTVTPYTPLSPIIPVTFTSPMELDVNGREMMYARTLTLVNILDFSSNNLTGEIPKEIARLLTLGTLNMSWNCLIGEIPEEIGSLHLLETLDLSHNHLSGPIPLSMPSMTMLNHLNLSFNNLSGPIPTANQFLTFNDPSIYMGNTELCGSPLPNKCHAPNARDAKDHQGFSTDDNDEVISGKFGFFISMALGFIIAFWAVFGSLSTYEPWRNATNRLAATIAVKMTILRQMMK